MTYSNISKMYDLVYAQMVKDGVSHQLHPSEYYYVNAEGEKVECETSGVGLQVKIEIKNPQWILFGDEVGTDISMKDDGHVGGQKFVCKRGSRENITSSHKDIRFTLLGLTAATGEPVMCVVIFSGKELSFEQRMGHNIRVPFDTTQDILENTGPGKRFSGGPS